MSVISNCEKKFIFDCIVKSQKRLDGRELIQGRTLEIAFGEDRGSCIVILGNTRVLVQVSSVISEANPMNPTVGRIFVNLELSSMSSPDAKSFTRASEEFVELLRSLERCIRFSKCIDLESLCIITESKVWTIRVDVHTLNDDGNLTECASIAAMSALAHFRLPLLTVVGNDINLDSIKSEPVVPLNLHHMPISINLALFDNGKYILVDPNEMEEKVCNGCYIIGMNAHQEICSVHRRGVLLLKEDVIIKCENIAIKRAQEITQLIRSALDDDAHKRLTKAPIGFANLIQSGTILGEKRFMPHINLDKIQNMLEKVEIKAAEAQPIEMIDVESESADLNATKKVVYRDRSRFKSKAKQNALRLLQEDEAAAFEGGCSKWDDATDEKDSEKEEEIPEIKTNISAIKERNSSDSEEETVYINKEQLDIKTADKRGWFKKDPFA